MPHINFSYEHVLPFLPKGLIEERKHIVKEHHEALHAGTGIGHEWLGWLDVPTDKGEMKRIKEAAAKIKADTDVLVVIGVGGSYLGAHAAIEMLQPTFDCFAMNEKREVPKVIFTGYHLSATYNQELLEALKHVDVSVNVISKSGTTMEPAIAFRLFRSFLEEKYGKAEAAKRIYVTTDAEKGALKQLADENGYETFVIPDDIGGRYSVLTPVGLLPMAASGIDIDAVIEGARDSALRCLNGNIEENEAYQYALVRNLLYEHGFKTEILANYDPKLRYMADWWTQLFGESEGKNGKGIFPVSVNYPTDLHSLGQYIQDGERHLFQTIVRVREEDAQIAVTHDVENVDELNYLTGKSLSEINRVASEATLKAHVSGGVPNMVIDLPELDAYTFGYLVYFFKKACAMSGYLLDVNPFDQPGVEAYKNNMFEMLGKFESEKI